MKVSVALLVAGLMIQPAIFAQTQEKSTVEKVGEKVSDALNVFQDSVSGCLQRGDEADAYIIRDPDKDKSTTVVGSSDLALHVNHQVKVRGEFEDSGRVFNAKEVEMISADCTSKAAPPSTASTSTASTDDAGLAAQAADNTGVNRQIGRHDDTTADDQNVNRTDQDITRRIRRMVVEDKKLSTYAHNVKIITQNGQVILKGPVRSETERSRIAELAASVAGASKVQNELTVAPGR